ncbi:hypothetical protein [Ligilactobacillus equi]|nr:hypothetical protein [Ligilactobacillus equi]
MAKGKVTRSNKLTLSKLERMVSTLENSLEKDPDFGKVISVKETESHKALQKLANRLTKVAANLSVVEEEYARAKYKDAIPTDINLDDFLELMSMYKEEHNVDLSNEVAPSSEKVIDAEDINDDSSDEEFSLE